MRLKELTIFLKEYDFMIYRDETSFNNRDDDDNDDVEILKFDDISNEDVNSLIVNLNIDFYFNKRINILIRNISVGDCYCWKNFAVSSQRIVQIIKITDNNIVYKYIKDSDDYDSNCTMSFQCFYKEFTLLKN